MSYLDRLLEGVEVEWKPLGEFADYEQPTRYLVRSSNYSEKYSTPVLTAGKTFVLGYTDETDGIYKASINPVIIFDDFTTANKWVDFDFKAKSSAMKMITSKDESKALLKYIYYWLNTLPSGLVEGDHKRQWISNYSTRRMPIPCPDNPKKSLEIQKKIVDILDKFTDLTAELTADLTAELTARKKQYNYYREELLCFVESDVEWKTLGEIAIIGTGSRNTNESVVGGNYPFFVRSQKPRTINEYEFDETAIITAGDGVGVGKVFHYVTGKYALHQRAYRIVTTDNLVDAKFLFYFLRSNFAKYLETKSVHASVTSLRKPMFEKYRVPVPSIQKQKRIVTILDKFDTVTNSITVGLLKEIELRQKQYDYYRDMLLTFPKDSITI